MARATSVRKKEIVTSGGNGSISVISQPLTLEDEIRLNAYLLYEKEGRQDGRDNEYWLRAESEVLAHRGQPKG